jgi:hypothetical protein
MTTRPQVPAETVARLRAICRALPEAQEQDAWVGLRWRIRGKTFAHVLMIADGWPPAYAKAAATEGPACVLTFRSLLADVDDTAFRTHPFFKPVWWPDIAGLIFGENADWDDVAALVAASYRLLAPRRLTIHQVKS